MPECRHLLRATRAGGLSPFQPEIKPGVLHVSPFLRDMGFGRRDCLRYLNQLNPYVLEHSQVEVAGSATIRVSQQRRDRSICTQAGRGACGKLARDKLFRLRPRLHRSQPTYSRAP